MLYTRHRSIVLLESYAYLVLQPKARKEDLSLNAQHVHPIPVPIPLPSYQFSKVTLGLPHQSENTCLPRYR